MVLIGWDDVESENAKQFIFKDVIYVKEKKWIKSYTSIVILRNKACLLLLGFQSRSY